MTAPVDRDGDDPAALVAGDPDGAAGSDGAAVSAVSDGAAGLAVSDGSDVGARVVEAVRTTLWPELHPLAERFAAAGHRLYLVGGTVRDLVAGDDRPAFDLDATTTARPAEIKRLIADWADAVWTQGERFGTIGAMKEAPDGGEPRIYEITTHRAEAYASDSRKPDVVFSDDVVADLSRRDFTVNAMAVEITTPAPVLVDPFGGAADLAAGVLRTPLTPVESFGDDPLRMLRAARFLTRYGLEPVPELTAAVREMGVRLSIVSAERIRDELDKLLVTRRPGPGLRFLVDTGLLAHAVPALAELHPVRLDATVAAVPAAGPAPAGWWGDPPVLRLVRWAGLLAELDASDARRVLRDLRASNEDVGAVSTVVDCHRRWFAGPVSGATSSDATSDATSDDGAWSPADVRRVVRDARGHLAEVLALAHAMGAPAGPVGTVPGRSAATWLAGAELLRRSGEDLGDLAPPLDGAAVMALLGIEPGPLVGRALAYLAEQRIVDGPIPPDRAGASLREWWHHHSE